MHRQSRVQLDYPRANFSYNRVDGNDIIVGISSGNHEKLASIKRLSYISIYNIMTNELDTVIITCVFCGKHIRAK